MLASLSSLCLALPPSLTIAQDGALDRLHHPPGTVTGRAGIAHVERRGTGPVLLVLIAGAPYGWRAWEGFMTRNAARYTMLAITPAGYDGTPPPPMPETEQEDYVERAWTEPLMADLVAAIEKEKLAPAVIVGHHLMGDYYAVRLAAEHPELVRGVVSVAGQGTSPLGQEPVDPEKRAAIVRGSRAPFYRSVTQETWNAGTFTAAKLSKDGARGTALYAAEVAVPIETQVRYFLEYMTDELESRIPFVQVPVLALTVPSTFSLDDLSQSMRDQLIQRFGSLEEAKKQVRMGEPWGILAGRAEPGSVRVQAMEDTGIFAMDDVPEAFDRAVQDFVASLPVRASEAAAPAKKSE